MCNKLIIKGFFKGYVHSFIPPEKRGGGVEYFGCSEIGGGLALISGFWGT